MPVRLIVVTSEAAHRRGVVEGGRPVPMTSSFGTTVILKLIMGLVVVGVLAAAIRRCATPGG